MGGGDRKFSKMIELLGPQNRKMVELLGVKFAQKGIFLNFLRRLRRRQGRPWGGARGRTAPLGKILGGTFG